MSEFDELRPILRAAAKSGDVVEVALALRAHWAPGNVTQGAWLLRDEFGLTIPEAVAIASWAEGGDEGDEGSRALLRSRVQTRLRPDSPEGQ